MLYRMYYDTSVSPTADKIELVNRSTRNLEPSCIPVCTLEFLKSCFEMTWQARGSPAAKADTVRLSRFEGNPDVEKGSLDWTGDSTDELSEPSVTHSGFHPLEVIYAFR